VTVHGLLVMISEKGIDDSSERCNNLWPSHLQAKGGSGVKVISMMADWGTWVGNRPSLWQIAFRYIEFAHRPFSPTRQRR
jgi:hypothetical protein